MNTTNNLSVHDLKEVMDQSEHPILIDVRTPVEFRSIHIASAKNIPLNELDENSLDGEVSKEDTVHLICYSGGRSQKALDKLLSLGYSHAVSIDGGISSWINHQFDVVQGKKTISIERQVRIAAGGLVVLGVILSLLVHPYCIGISAFVGAGLVFAGITDTCGMGLMLAKMPWNS